MNNRNSSSNRSNQSGLYLSGTVVDRTRRSPRNNPSIEIVTYTVADDNNHRFFVDDYDAHGQYYDLDKYVSLPIYIKSYIKKNGELSFNLNIQKNQNNRGEHF